MELAKKIAATAVDLLSRRGTVTPHDTTYFSGSVSINKNKTLVVMLTQDEQGRFIILVKCTSTDKNEGSKMYFYSLTENGDILSGEKPVEGIPVELVDLDLQLLHANLRLFLTDRQAAAEQGILPG